jgi:hypothetical protein
VRQSAAPIERAVANLGHRGIARVATVKIATQTTDMNVDAPDEEWEVEWIDFKDAEPGVNAVFDMAKKAMLDAVPRRKALIETIRANILLVAKEKWPKLGVMRWHKLNCSEVHNDDVDFFATWSPDAKCADYPMPEAEYVELDITVDTTFNHQGGCRAECTDCACQRTHLMVMEVMLKYEDVTLKRKRAHDQVDE